MKARILTSLLLALVFGSFQTQSAQADDRSLEISITYESGHHGGYYETEYVLEEYYFHVDADIRTNQYRYDLGECLDVDVRVDEDAYVYLFLEDPYGGLTQLFPNFHDNDNYLRRNRWYSFPGRGYSYIADGYTGEHKVFVMASTVKIPSLESRFAVSCAKDPFPVCGLTLHDVKYEILGYYEHLAHEHFRNSLPYDSYSNDCIRISKNYLPGFGKDWARVKFEKPYRSNYYSTYHYSKPEVIIRDRVTYYPHRSHYRSSHKPSHYSSGSHYSFTYNYSSSNNHYSHGNYHNNHNNHNEHNDTNNHSYTNRSGNSDSGYRSFSGGTTGKESSSGYSSFGGTTTGRSSSSSGSSDNSFSSRSSRSTGSSFSASSNSRSNSGSSFSTSSGSSRSNNSRSSSSSTRNSSSNSSRSNNSGYSSFSGGTTRN